MILVLYFLILY